MKKLLALSIVSLLTVSIGACSSPSGPIKDGVCSDTNTGSSLPGMIDPDCGAASPAK